MAHIAIVGVGAIGGVVAAQLALTGRHQITLCTRRPLDQLIVQTQEGDIMLKTENITDPLSARIADWVLMATKTYDTMNASSFWLPKLCGKDTPVAVLQNGVEHRELLAAAVNREKMIPVIIDCPAERQENGRMIQRGPVFMQVENTQPGTDFSALFIGSKAVVTATDDFLTAAWQKLCLNAAGAISALLMKPAGILQDELLARAALDIVSECVAVGKAEGARLEESIGGQVLERYRLMPPDSINSMLADRIAGRRMEYDARNGVIVRKGEIHGIPTPANKLVVALLQALSNGATSPTNRKLQ
jgi:2-dehydropantoate 2-reductase